MLYDDVLRIDPKNPRDPERDRAILSKGHGCLALYALLADRGFFPLSELDDFCGTDSILGGHPEYGMVPGVEASTGALGHGLSIGVGLALAARMRGRAYRTFVLMGDGEINEGSVWEAAMGAAKHGLDNLVALIDYNKLQSYGPTDYVLPLEPLADKWRSFGFVVEELNGHDVGALRNALGKVPAHAGPPDGDHLPHRQGQGPAGCRIQRRLASQEQVDRTASSTPFASPSAIFDRLHPCATPP